MLIEHLNWALKQSPQDDTNRQQARLVRIVKERFTSRRLKSRTTLSGTALGIYEQRRQIRQHFLEVHRGGFRVLN